MTDNWWLLIIIGLAVGTLGTLIGAGGGFILVPVLLMLMPKADATHVTAISLAVVFCNATSGSIAYLRMGRVDLKSAASFAIATLPGAILGAMCTKWIPRDQFNIVFGVLLVLASLYLIWRPESGQDPGKEHHPKHTRRELTDNEGIEHVWHFPMSVGLGLSVLVGFFSSLLGIGGGIIHVPVLNRTLNFPVHIATATSHVILSVMALVGTVTHYYEGSLTGNFETIAFIGGGAIVGAQIGARLSNLLEGSGIIRALAVALGIVGVRILMISLR